MAGRRPLKRRRLLAPVNERWLTLEYCRVSVLGKGSSNHPPNGSLLAFGDLFVTAARHHGRTDSASGPDRHHAERAMRWQTARTASKGEAISACMTQSSLLNPVARVLDSATG